MDNFQTKKQQRLLVEPLYSSWQPGRPFIAAANVGIFSSAQEEGTAPDAFLSLDVSMPADWSQKQNRSYLVWRFGKFPDVAIEIVSNPKGNELLRKDAEKPSKKETYARMGIAYYAVFDPLQQLQEANQMNGQPLKVFELRGKHYIELSHPFWMEDAGLGLTFWDGEFEGVSGQWLRWCVYPEGGTASQRDRQVIPTGAERADEVSRKAQQLADRLRELGVNPDEI